MKIPRLTPMTLMDELVWDHVLRRVVPGTLKSGYAHVCMEEVYVSALIDDGRDADLMLALTWTEVNGSLTKEKRVKCRKCGRLLRLRKDGTLPNHREPRVYRSQHHKLEWCITSGTLPGGGESNNTDQGLSLG